jgi:uncharacterized protein
MRFDLPTPDLETQPYWDAARDSKLLIKRCNACGRHHFYPRPFCPTCWSDDVEWVEASGDATLYTWSIVHRNDLPPFHEWVPYVTAVVDLVEGPRMMTTVINCDHEALEIGMALSVEYRAISDDVTVPVFRPAGADADANARAADGS